MDNKEWLLNAAAIKSARQCIKSVEKELGVRLKLSHPDFLSLLSEYAELTDNIELKSNYAALKQYSDHEENGELVQEVVVPFSNTVKVAYQNTAKVNKTSQKVEIHDAPSPEKIVFHGKEYIRWKDGREFKGLYRGQPRYA